MVLVGISGLPRVSAGVALAATVAAGPVRANVIAATTTPTQQGTASPLGRIDPVRVPLEVSLKLNGKFLGTISVAVDAKGAGQIDARRLIELMAPVVDAKLIAALNARIAGRPTVDFTELDAPGFTLRFDSLSLEAVGTLAADATRPVALRLGQQQDIPVPSGFDQPAEFAAGVNVGLGQRYRYGSGGGFDRVRSSLDGIVNIGGFDGVTLTGGTVYDGEGWQRREFRATHDLFDKAIRLTAGEFTPGATSFQGSGRILGVGIDRSYATIRPFQNTRPIGRQQFTLDRDASVDVIVNQIRVQTIRLAAGRYDIGDFPFAAGSNQVQLVVEDIGGRREILNFDVFNTNILLAPGITEYGGAIGLRERHDLHYGRSPAATAFGYHGFSDLFTAGVNAQATSLGAQAGAVMVVGTRLGFFQLEAAASQRFRHGDTGTAASLDYRGEFTTRTTNDLRIAASAIYRSATFQDAFSPDGRNATVLQTALQVQWRAPFDISLGLGTGYSIGRDRLPNSARLDANIGRSFGRWGLSTTASRVTFSDGRGNDTRIAIGLSLRLGQRDSANARYESGTGRSEFEFTHAPEGQLGEVSGSVRYTRDHDASALSGRLAYINNRFDLVVNHNRLEQAGPTGQTSNASDWNVRSFIGYAGGSFALGRSIDEGFVIAPVHPTLRGSQASIVSGDRVIARSGMLGPALVPLSRAYGIGRFDVKVDPLPAGYDLGSASIAVFPSYGSGYRTMIGSDASRIAVGFLVTDGGPVALVSGLIEPVDPVRRKTWKERSIFTNRAGRFVADRLEPGRYRITIAGLKPIEFAIGKDGEGVTDVGTLHIAR